MTLGHPLTRSKEMKRLLVLTFLILPSLYSCSHGRTNSMSSVKHVHKKTAKKVHPVNKEIGTLGQLNSVSSII